MCKREVVRKNMPKEIEILESRKENKARVRGESS